MNHEPQIQESVLIDRHRRTIDSSSSRFDSSGICIVPLRFDNDWRHYSVQGTRPIRTLAGLVTLEHLGREIGIGKGLLDVVEVFQGVKQAKRLFRLL